MRVEFTDNQGEIRDQEKQQVRIISDRCTEQHQHTIQQKWRLKIIQIITVQPTRYLTSGRIALSSLYCKIASKILISYICATSSGKLTNLVG